MDHLKGKGLVDDNASSNSSEHQYCTDAEAAEEDEESQDHSMSDGNAEPNRDDDFCSIVVERNLTKLTYDEILKREFLTLEGAEAFYISYARQVGFVARKASLKKTASGMPRERIFVCQKEGKRKQQWIDLPGRKRKPREDFREQCPARFKVNYNKKKGKWVVKKFVMEHSHALVPKNHVNVIQSHQNLGHSSETENHALHEGGVETRHIVDVFALQSGGYDKMSFIQKDVYNQVLEKGLEPPNGDVRGILSYFCTKKDDDPGFYHEKTVEDDGRMGNLFWADSISRFDYACFGDIIALDFAFKNNRYNRPFVMVTGINHHHQIIIFACAILVNETSNYSWVLKQLVQCMGKRPTSVVTDGDLSMRSAIREVLPESTHCLCSFHLKKNAARHVKDPNFSEDLVKLMFERIETDQFETEWVKLLEKYNLSNNEWVGGLYKDRMMWAEAYLIHYFFAGTRTFRCENMHLFLDSFVKKRLSFHEFILQYDTVLSKIRHEEAHLDHQARHKRPECKHPLREFEVPASHIYTLLSFNTFQEQLNQVVVYKDFAPPICNGHEMTYFVSRYNTDAQYRTVIHNTAENTLWCSCRLLQSTGFPCRHQLYVMKREVFSTIPSSLFMRRWTKDAKTSIPENFISGSLPEQALCNLRYGLLYTSCRDLCAVACKSNDTFLKVMELIAHLKQSIADMNRPT